MAEEVMVDGFEYTYKITILVRKANCKQLRASVPKVP